MNLLYTNDTLFKSGCETHDKFFVIIINFCHTGSLAVSVRILIKFVAEEFYYNLSSTICFRNTR